MVNSTFQPNGKPQTGQKPLSRQNEPMHVSTLCCALSHRLVLHYTSLLLTHSNKSFKVALNASYDETCSSAPTKTSSSSQNNSLGSLATLANTKRIWSTGYADISIHSNKK